MWGRTAVVDQSPHWSSMNRHYQSNENYQFQDGQHYLGNNRRETLSQQPVDSPNHHNHQHLLTRYSTNGVTGYWWLKNASTAVKNNRDAVLAIAQRNGRELQWAPYEFQDDFEVALTAVTQDGMALIDVSKGKQSNRVIVMAAVQQNGMALEYAGHRLRRDKEIVLAAVNQNGLALEFASWNLRKDRDVVLTAINENGMANKFIVGKLRKDNEVLATAVSRTMRGSRNSHNVDFYSC